MKQIQSMPDIWDDKTFTTSKSTVLGALAAAAIRQSPYTIPKNLQLGLAEFNGALTCGDFFVTSCEQLIRRIRLVIERCPTILDWNIPVKGQRTTIFCSCCSKLRPDYDFIDLDALVRNIAHTVTLEEKYNQLHD